MLGVLTGNIGFVTQFSVPAEYRMTFQVTDSYGKKSNTWVTLVAIEPTDGNSRPDCQLTISSDDVSVHKPLDISWEGSQDLDEGDQITAAKGLIFENGVPTDIQKYLVPGSLSTVGATFKFPRAGTYQVWFSVMDSHGAWSNWVEFTLHVNVVNYNDGAHFVYVSEQYDANGLFEKSIGYRGAGTYNGIDAFYIAPNATIYGSIGEKLSGGREDVTIGEFGSNECVITPVVGDGTVSKIQYIYNETSMYPGKWSKLQFSGEPGDIFFLDYNSHVPGWEATTAHCYFIMQE